VEAFKGTEIVCYNLNISPTAQADNLLHFKQIEENYVVVWAEKGDGDPIVHPSSEAITSLLAPRDEYDERAVFEAGVVKRRNQRSIGKEDRGGESGRSSLPMSFSWSLGVLLARDCLFVFLELIMNACNE
jgi:hypothetical protein